MDNTFITIYRHSLAHILAKAVVEIFGSNNVQYAIGPQISDGLYYDFILPRTVGPVSVGSAQPIWAGKKQPI